jgi:5'-nucleotidase
VRVLVTNDDGIHAPGLRVLAAAVLAAGHDVVVAAPDVDHSGAGTQLRVVAGTPVPVRRYDEPDLPGVPVVGVAGSPALVVLLTRLGAFGKAPRCVVSGINPGANTGRSVLHSGTVGAALTASSLGMSALAVSVAAELPRHLDTAAGVAGAALGWLAAARKRTVLNVNVPDVAARELRGVRWARLAAYGPVRAVITDLGPGHVTVGHVPGTLPLDPATDAGLVAAGYAAVTPLVGPRADDDDAAAAAMALVLSGPAPSGGVPGGIPSTRPRATTTPAATSSATATTR